MNAARWSAVVVVCALVGLFAFASVSAQAFVTHAYLPALSEKLSENIPATGPHGEAIALPGARTLESSASTVDAGHLWVYEITPSKTDARIEEYDASTGEFMGQIPHVLEICCGRSPGLTVGHLGGEGLLYLGGRSGGKAAVGVYSESGVLKGTWTGASTPAGSFGPFVGVAVDKSSDVLDEYKGDVFVADSERGVVYIFRPEADGKEHYVGRIAGVSPTEPFEFISGLATSEVNGDVVVREEGGIDIFEAGALGEYMLVHRITGSPNGPFHQVIGPVAVSGGDIYTTDNLETKGPKGEPLGSESVVEQFSPSGAFVGQFDDDAHPQGAFQSLSVWSLTLDQESHAYLTTQAEGSAKLEAYGGEIVLPDVTGAPPSSVTPFGAMFEGTVNPDNAGPATCRFEWGRSRSLGKVAACEPEDVPNGASPVAVHAAVSGLESDTTYYYRLQATNPNGTNRGEAAQDQVFTTAGPGIREASVTDLASTSVTFDASIDPHGVPSSIYFQYGTSASYGSEAPAAPGESIGSGEGAVEVTPRHVQGLLASTVYHYRIVVVTEPKPGSVVVFNGSDQTFTTQTAAVSELPDGRQWEMVSPPAKQGAKIYPIKNVGVSQAADYGGAISYLADLPTEAEPQGFSNEVQVLSTRGAAGWETRDLTLPHTALTGPSIGPGLEYRRFSADLSHAVVHPFTPFDLAELSIEASEQTAMLQSLDPSCGSSCYRPLVTGKPGYANVALGTVFGEESSCHRLFCGPEALAATPDLSHLIVSLQGVFVEWTDGKLSPPIDVKPDGTLMQPEPDIGLGNEHRGAVSSDGSRVILTLGFESGLYMRDLKLEKTAKLDVAEPGCVAEGECRSGGGRFVLASTDDSKVFFTSENPYRLTKDAGTTGEDLYECEMVEKAGTLECKLSHVAREVLGVLGASERDASYLYFVARSVLAEGAVAGEPNLYVRHDGVTKLIAILSTEDSHDWTTELYSAPVRVSPDGGWVEFMSQRPLTGYDNRDAVNGNLDAEVYLYDAATGRLVCASCDPTGARPIGVEYAKIEPNAESGGFTGGPDDVWNRDGWVAAIVPGWVERSLGAVANQPRYLSDSGRLFFNSSDALVAQDVNGTSDVYEYEPSGVGNCTTAGATFGERSGGCVGLISAGTSPRESGFLDASETGGDVFFLTYSRLLQQDYDNAPDVYDAHECTSAVPCFPAAVPVPPPCTTAEACRAAPTPQPANFGAPSSATFSGAGNIAPGSGGVATAKSLTRAQKLASALKTCKRKPKKKRAVCEKRARAQYGSAGSANAAKKKGKR